MDIKYSTDHTRFKFQQIIDSVINDIQTGVLKNNDRLPSMNVVCEQEGLSKVTVQRAYMHLKKKGYITKVAGKGFCVVDKDKQKLKVLLIFNKISYYKKLIYYGILEILAENARVDLQIHHYDVKILNDIIAESAGKYDYYVVMPHFFYETPDKNYLNALKKIPQQKLLMLDKDVNGLNGSYMAVYQDFENDTYNALVSVADMFVKYDRLVIIIPAYSNHPLEIIDGVRKFAGLINKKFDVSENAEDETLQAGTAYIAIEETELAELIKKIRQTNLKLGQDIGIISFNETVLKELMDITVFTTDFTEMGRTVGNLLIKDQCQKVKMPFRVLRRGSL
ncbi:GntR family transcriptional regulator [Mucilaginibacter boryungensis]|uniref:GntR family transcriptional regulator n=1 Tax=Mucilaginibacter boryungensis TaxID=768480 RepID=A0ABR9XG79_9SPHI|nr:GntR family transcriptional regulator [Mucilaginibacter boryungensis]MBE9666187.1 GntR family transcriptional regulator [Mucilaginibacter boryungensis]